MKMAWVLRCNNRSLLIGLLRVVTLMVSKMNRLLLNGPGCDASPILKTGTGWHPFTKKIQCVHEDVKNLIRFSNRLEFLLALPRVNPRRELEHSGRCSTPGLTNLDPCSRPP